MQGYMLGSFYVGYSIGQIPAGVLADQIGGRKTYTMGVGISSTFTLVFPFIIMETPWYCVCVGRIFMGIAQVNILVTDIYIYIFIFYNLLSHILTCSNSYFGAYLKTYFIL